MTYNERIQRAVDYIEDNLKNQINLQDVANNAFYSLYHFHRVFHAIVGVSISDYIRKRRLSNSAYQLLTSKRKIIEIAFDNGYEAPESFSRAFKRIYGKSPSSFRKNQIECQYFTKVDIANLLDITKGDFMQEPKIVTRSAFDIIGYALRTKAGGENFDVIPKFWQDILINDKLKNIPNQKDSKVCLGLCTDYNKETDEFSYLACAEVTDTNNIPDDMEHVHVPAGKYAVFTSKGLLPKAIQDLTVKIYRDWLPNSKYDHAMAPEFELYDERTTNDENCEVDIYLPIIEKS